MESEIQSVAGVQGSQHRVYAVAISQPTSFSPPGVEVPLKSSDRQRIPHGIGYSSVQSIPMEHLSSWPSILLYRVSYLMCLNNKTARGLLKLAIKDFRFIKPSPALIIHLTARLRKL